VRQLRVAANAAAVNVPAEQAAASLGDKPRTPPVSAADMTDDAGTLAEEVWRSLGDALHAFIRARVPSKSDADDILQDVFIRVIEKSASIRRADRIESWVYQTARNAIADFYRRRPPRPDSPVEEVDVSLGEATEADYNHAVGACLKRMAAQLPDKLREAVLMYETEDLSQLEIAKRLRISLSGAKSRIQRGRRQLEELFRSCCELEFDRRGNVLESRCTTPGCCSPGG
jgi:RNA polymerase sigma-70 factor (ECF subfamily)